jgi:predicted nucleotidyltransferase
MTIQDIKKQIIPTLRRGGVLKASIFGSFARGDYNKRSDVDLLVQFGDDQSLLDLVGLKFDLEEKLGRKVDILTYRSIHPLLKEIIMREQKIIYEKRQ